MADKNSDGTAIPLKGEENHRDEVDTGEVDGSHQTFKEKWKNRVYKRKIIKTLCLGAVFEAFGFAIGQRGPAFLDLQIITHTDMEAAAFFFTSASAGYLVGSLVAGVVYDKLNKSLLLLLTVLGLAVTTVAVPWCSPYTLMLAIHFVASLFAGGLDTVGLAELAHVWGKDEEMAIQFLQFNYAFGGAISPLVTELFLAPIPEVDNGNASRTAASSPNSSTTIAISPTHRTIKMLNATENSTIPTPPLTTTVHYAFLITGIHILLVAIPLTVEFFNERHQKRQQDQRHTPVEVRPPLPLGLFLFASFFLCLFFFVHCCVADTFAPYLMTFVVKQLRWSKTRGAQVSSVSLASLAIGHFLSIFAARLLSSAQLIVLCSVAQIFSMLGFLLFADHAIDAGVWVCTVSSSMSMGPIFATCFAWMEAELVQATGRMASAITIASSASGMVNPAMLAHLMEEYTPMWFCYLLFAESVLCLLAFLFLLATTRLCVSKHYVTHKAKKQKLNVESLCEEETEAEEEAAR